MERAEQVFQKGVYPIKCGRRRPDAITIATFRAWVKLLPALSQRCVPVGRCGPCLILGVTWENQSVAVPRPLQVVVLDTNEFDCLRSYAAAFGDSPELCGGGRSALSSIPKLSDEIIDWMLKLPLPSADYAALQKSKGQSSDVWPDGYAEAVQAFQRDLPVCSVESCDISPDCQQFIPQDIRQKYACACFALTDKQAFCVCSPDCLIQFRDAVSNHYASTGLKGWREIVLVLASRDAIKTCAQVESHARVVAHGARFERDAAKKKSGWSLSQEDCAPVLYMRDTTVTAERAMGWILAQATEAGASDIHIEYMAGGCGRVRLRQDGICKVLVPASEMSEQRLTGIINVLKDRAKLLENQYSPQDGGFDFTCRGERYDVRVSMLPVYAGEGHSVCCRILPETTKLNDLEKLNIAPPALEAIRSAMLQKQGLILVTGPTGSGKNTTLNAALSGINDPARVIVTLERPIEQKTWGVVQCAVDDLRGADTTALLRGFLRHDPDVIMVGEIRDAETAEAAIHASMTGHLVLGTLHVTSAAEVIPRLSFFSKDTYAIASNVVLLQGQRLLRRLCPKCKVSVPLSGEDVRLFESNNLHPPARVWAPVGCPSCHGGYRGRQVAMEVIPVDDKMREIIMAACENHAFGASIHQYATERGYSTILQDALRLAANGETSLAEARQYERAF